MAKPKSDYAIVLSCNPAYGFGMISCMNAQNYFKTNADWEVAYEHFTDMDREKISAAFPFNVNWTSISELMTAVVDKRTDQKQALEKYWLAYWLLAYKLLKEKKYKAVCVIQADAFYFVNLDVYFKIAEAGFLVCAEHSFTYKNAEDLEFGDDRAIWDRSQCAIFDSINFIGQQYTELPMDIVHYQEEDSFRREANHSVVALNRAVCKHGNRNKILGLDRRLWVCDAIWNDARLKTNLEKDKVYNDLGLPLKGWHCRWWQKGRTEGEWLNNKARLIEAKKIGDKDLLNGFVIQEHNYNLVRDFMLRFNDMTPEVRSDEYLHGVIRRPRWENGEV